MSIIICKDGNLLAEKDNVFVKKSKVVSFSLVFLIVDVKVDSILTILFDKVFVFDSLNGRDVKGI